MSALPPLALVALVAWLGAGCDEARTVPTDKVEGAIRSLPYEVRFRQVARPADAKLLVAGRLRDAKTGTAIDFSVRVGKPGYDGPIVPGAGQDTGTGCAGAVVTTSSSATASTRRDRMWRMGAALEDAIFGLAPGVTCEP